MSKFPNSGKDKFLLSIPTASIELPEDTLHSRCKFNFSFFEKQAAGQDFSDWSKEGLVSLFTKLKDFGKQPLEYWMHQRVGKSGTVLAIYGAFPANSSFSVPKSVPHQAYWGRFRLDWSARLCGFIIPSQYEGKIFQKGGKMFCSNTFYVTFLDENHEFYPGNESK